MKHSSVFWGCWLQRARYFSPAVIMRRVRSMNAKTCPRHSCIYMQLLYSLSYKTHEPPTDSRVVGATELCRWISILQNDKYCVVKILRLERFWTRAKIMT